MTAPLRVKVNSLDFATRASLSQQSKKDNKWYFITFFSKFLSMVKCNLKFYNNKILAVIWALKEWRCFLEDIETSVKI